MTNTIQFTVYGEPVAKGRPRYSTRGGFPRSYTPAKTLRAEDDFRAQALSRRPSKPVTGQVDLEVSFYRSIPKSFSKRKRQDALDGRIAPTTRPDVDNYVKLICDAMNGIFWQDDAQIVCMRVHKKYSDTPRTEVTMTYEGGGE